MANRRTQRNGRTQAAIFYIQAPKAFFPRRMSPGKTIRIFFCASGGKARLCFYIYLHMAASSLAIRASASAKPSAQAV